MTGLCLVGEDRGAARSVVAATADGSIVRLSLEGEIKGCQEMGSAVTVMTAVDPCDGVDVVVGTEDGEVVGLGGE